MSILDQDDVRLLMNKHRTPDDKWLSKERRAECLLKMKEQGYTCRIVREDNNYDLDMDIVFVGVFDISSHITYRYRVFNGWIVRMIWYSNDNVYLRTDFSTYIPDPNNEWKLNDPIVITDEEDLK